MYGKFDKLLIVSCIQCIVTFLFAMAVFYLRRSFEIDAELFDIQSTTISDYTLRLELNQDQIEEFIKDAERLKEEHEIDLGCSYNDKDYVPDKDGPQALTLKWYLSEMITRTLAR